MRIARVQPLTTARALRGPFDYLLPEDFPEVEVGSRLSVPFAGRKLDAVVVELDSETEVPEAKLASPIGLLSPSVPADLVDLAVWTADAYCSTPARALALVTPPGGGRTGAKTALCVVITPEGKRVLNEGGRLTDGQRAALEELAKGPVSASEMELGHSGLRRLEGRGLVHINEERVMRRPSPSLLDAGRVAPSLNGEQEAAVAEIVESMDSDSDDAGFLLHGITGSGKTEVYIHAAEEALTRGKGVIVLVPEIALTPQAVARFTARLGDTVAVLHSGLSAGERHDEWTRLSDGEASVCIGPRSAVFAPVRNLGLVIVDEEHESAYRNDGDPGYDARELASRRAAYSRAVLVAGSATPRPESVRRLKRLRLEGRADGSPLPPVELVDMKGQRGVLHSKTLDALTAVRNDGAKAIVLLNRRGWSNFVSCSSCGHTWSCPSCDVTLVLHKARHRLECHHCGHSEPVPTSCPECRSSSVGRHGAGTERLASELDALFKDSGFPIFRLDTDSAAAKGETERILAAFQRAESGVLVGTQMVAKGHDFPDVTLGVVVDADSTLRFPDFRSEERTFQLVTQLAGRAGRGEKGGTVIVQTESPEAEALVFASRHDADGFLEAELERRDALHYPPAAALVRIQCAGQDEVALDEVADALVELLDESGCEVLGPAPLFRLKGRERRQIVARSGDRDLVVSAVAAAVSEVAKVASKSDVSIGTEVDAG